MSFVSGQNRKLSSHTGAQTEVHTVGCNSEDNSKHAFAVYDDALLDANDVKPDRGYSTVSFQNKSSCMRVKPIPSLKLWRKDKSFFSELHLTS